MLRSSCELLGVSLGNIVTACLGVAYRPWVLYCQRTGYVAQLDPRARLHNCRPTYFKSSPDSTLEGYAIEPTRIRNGS